MRKLTNIQGRPGSGFTLVELAIALVIIALVLVLFIGASSGFISSKRNEVTSLKLKAIENSIALFVAQNKRLPCPADGTISSGAPFSGVEQRDIVTGDCLPLPTPQINGVVPALSLGLSEADVLDGWNNRITYRVYSNVPGSLTRTDGMDLSWCDPAGTAASAIAPNNLCTLTPPTCSSAALANCVTPTQFLANKGLRIQNAAGTIPPLMDPAAGQGAAYVLISHGDNSGGAYSTSGTLLGPVGPQVGTEEAFNNNGTSLRLSPNYYVDSGYNGSDTTNHFDDLVLRPSIISVASKAQLGPRAH
ncbi:MAG: type II secretion system GspH family protein [Rhodocyclaceae bacterium]|nr:type II secretion system GspH family protein [Rhodocyclaceae bacterium]